MLLWVVSCGADAENPPAETVFKSYITAACEKMYSCLGSNFIQYYKSVNDCTDKGMTLFDKSKTGKPSTCTKSEVDSCVNDVRGVSCDGKFTPDDFDMPESCKKC